MPERNDQSQPYYRYTQADEEVVNKFKEKVVKEASENTKRGFREPFSPEVSVTVSKPSSK